MDNRSQCPLCDKLIHKSGMTRHQQSSACLPEGSPYRFCVRCGDLVSKHNMRRHQRSLACVVPAGPSGIRGVQLHGKRARGKSPAEDSRPAKRARGVANSDVECTRCGKFVHEENLKRHKRSVACLSVDSTKTFCFRCGKLVNKNRLPRHQQSTACLPEESTQRYCFSCNTLVSKSNYSRHRLSPACIALARNNRSRVSLLGKRGKSISGPRSVKPIHVEETKSTPFTRQHIDRILDELLKVIPDTSKPEERIRVEETNAIPFILQNVKRILDESLKAIPSNSQPAKPIKVEQTIATPSTSQHAERNRDEQTEATTSTSQIPTPANQVEPPYVTKLVASTFQGRLKTFCVENEHTVDPENFLADVKQTIVETITKEVAKRSIKFNMVLVTMFGKTSEDGTPIETEIYSRTKQQVVDRTSDVGTLYDTAVDRILNLVSEFDDRGSGWTFKKVLALELRVTRYVPLGGGSYIPLPREIELKKAVVNVKNYDQKCFLWAILAALHPVDTHVDRVGKYKPYEHEFDDALKGIEMPVALTDIAKFEKKSRVTVNVYAYDNRYGVHPLRIAGEEGTRHVNLLFVKKGINTHYCWIRNMSRLVRSQITKHTTNLEICNRCLQHFSTKQSLDSHMEDCSKHDSVKTRFPQPGTPESVVKFKDFKCSMKVPFVFYADFETELVPINDEQDDEREDEQDDISSDENAQEKVKQSYTRKYQKHEAMSMALYRVFSGIGGGSREHHKAPMKYFGSDAAKVFVRTLLNESVEIAGKYDSANAVPMRFTEEDETRFHTAFFCHICGNVLRDDRVRDHDHLTGVYRGAAHSSCNLNYRKPKFIPVFLHNSSGYDTHLIIKEFSGYKQTVNIIPTNEERYISFIVKVQGGIDLRFLDSFRFQPSSLEKLISNLSEDQFVHTSRYYAGERLRLLRKKGVYPYDYMSSAERYEETQLPPKTAFYSRLNKCGITDEDYAHAQNVWREFGVTSMREYTLLYNESDVLQLADVMETFRDVCFRTYDLDPAWYFTAPGLAWSAMLKTTDVKLDLLTDPNMYLMIEKGVRGGISQCSQRHVIANNRYLKSRPFDASKPENYLMYYDANNLYGWSMTHYMPKHNLKWCNPNIDVRDVPDDSETGYILEVDLEYPRELHDEHSDYPLAPEQRIPPGSKQPKLLTTLYDKTKYVVHYRALKLYLRLGMRLVKIHRVISFTQSDWLRPYIELNTEKRTAAQHESDKEFYKLMINAVFGKTMENIRNRVSIRLATHGKQVEKWSAQPNYIRYTEFGKNLAAMHFAKTNVFFNKPIYVGMSVLDVSKLLMYEFHYDVMKRKYGDGLTLLYTDTDSLTYDIRTADVYEDMKTMIERFDTSNYPTDNVYSMPRVNKKVLGCFKDENAGCVMVEFAGLRSKVYANKIEDSDGKLTYVKKAKGMKKSVVKNELEFENYVRCVYVSEKIYKQANAIRSYRHDLYTVEQQRIALSANDDKRCVTLGEARTLPWGHYSIIEQQQQAQE